MKPRQLTPDRNDDPESAVGDPFGDICDEFLSELYACLEDLSGRVRYLRAIHRLPDCEGAAMLSRLLDQCAKGPNRSVGLLAELTYWVARSRLCDTETADPEVARVRLRALLAELSGHPLPDSVGPWED